MIKKIALAMCFAITFCVTAQSQELPNFIGYKKEDIKDYLAEHEPDYQLKQETKGFGLLYKVNNRLEKSRIFLLQEHNICYAYQMAFDYNVLNQIISDLNTYYVKVGDYEWLDYTDKLTYKLALVKEKSFFLVQRSLHKLD